MIKIFYFASLRESIGVAEESVAMPATATVGALIGALRDRGGVYAEVLAVTKRWRVAVNQDMAQLTDPIKAGDEVAIFPPVTGG